MEQPILLCGLGRTGWHVLDYLRAANLPVVVIDNRCDPDDPRLHGTRLILGDFRQRAVLLEAGIEQARGVMILTADDLVNTSTALLVRNLNRSVRIVLRMFNQNLLGRLGKAVENIFTMSTSMLTAPMLALTALTGQGLGSFRIEGLEEGQRQAIELILDEGNPLVGQSLHNLRRGRDLHVLSHRRPGEFFRLLGEVEPETILQAGDELVLCGPGRELTPLSADPLDPARRSWIGWLGHQLLLLRRSLPEMDVALLLVFVVLVLVIALGTLTLTLGAGNTPTDALVRTLTALTTANSTIDAKYHDPLPITFFLTGLKIMGTAIVAGLTAILTNHLLRARFGQAFEARKVPGTGHVIVCGLTPVGFRVVEELLQVDEHPVAIERDESNRFVATLRRQGVPVILGDATVPEVLRQANAGSARAVVVATNQDLLNLEVALLVRELNEDQRVVVLQSEPVLAQMLREATQIRLAVSVHALAAPAFLAGLFGDRVLNVILVRDRILAVVDLVAQGSDDVLLDQSVRTIAVDYQLVPIALLPAGESISATPLLHRFAEGDRMIAIIALSDLERLLKRQNPAREYGVDLENVPIPARPWVVSQLRLLFQCDAETAEGMLSRLPLRLGPPMTRGQAEDLIARFQREKVTVRRIDPTPALPVTTDPDPE
jgi:Trk K+ transport system NAD-binding subunit